MSQHERVGNTRVKRPLSAQAKIFAGTAMAVGVGIIFGASRIGSHDVKSEALQNGKPNPEAIYNPTVRPIVRPAMVENGRRIMAIYWAHPAMANKIVSKNLVMVSVNGISEARQSDGAVVDAVSVNMATGRTPGSQVPNLRRIQSINVDHSSTPQNDPWTGSDQNFGLYARGQGLYIATAVFNPFPESGMNWTPPSDPDFTPDLVASTNENGFHNSLAAGSHAPAVARLVVRLAPNILDVAEADLASMSPLEHHPAS